MVYFIKGQRTGYIKIGYTRDLKKRFESMQTGSPDKLRVLLLIVGNKEVEQKLHEQFKANRVHGEWFYPSDELIKYINDERLYQSIQKLKRGETGFKRLHCRAWPLSGFSCKKGKWTHR